MPRVTLFGWIKRGWGTAHQQDDRRRSWVIHADRVEPIPSNHLTTPQVSKPLSDR